MSTVPEIKKLRELLEPILENGAKILNCDTYHLIPPGENYGGIILAVDCDVKESDGLKKTLNFVAKLGPPNEMLCEMFNIQFTFKREMHTYIEIIPLLIQLQIDSNIPKYKILDLFPKCYAARLNLEPGCDKLDDDGVMIFENLKTQGFTMENRMVGFDLQHSEMFLKNLACFHALPIALKYLKPKEFKQKITVLKAASFGDSFSEEMKQTFLVELGRIINKLEGCKLYEKQIIDLVDKGFKFEERFLEPDSLFATVVHHDLWANNIMVLKNADGTSKKVKLYDLQLMAFGSLAHDLIFFLFSSVEQHVFDKHYDYLIKFYYDSFIGCLQDFKIDTGIFSWNAFLNELDLIGPHQISHIVIMLRPIFMEKGDVQDNADMSGDTMAKLQELNTGYGSKMRSIILAFAERNWL